MALDVDPGGGGGQRSVLAAVSVGCLFVVVLVAGAGVGAALAPGGGAAVTGAATDTGPYPHDVGAALQGGDVEATAWGGADDEQEAEDDEDEADDDEDEQEADEDETVPILLGDWWGLDVDADEAPYVGLAQLGTVVLVVGAGGYATNKRYSFVPVRYRRRTLQVHEWLMLVGTALVAPHFVFAEEIEGLGLFLGLLLGIEVLSGFYGRHLHRRVIRLSRGDETPAVVGRALETTNERLFSRWRRIHVTLVSITGLALLVHVLSEAL